jgi:hypothetical protein
MFNIFLERNVEYIAPATPALLGLQYKETYFRIIIMMKGSMSFSLVS